jgi:hypothetical protein
MMRKALLLAPLSAAAFALSAIAPASAHDAGPCAGDGPGHSDYAAHHVVFLAQAGQLGGGDLHNPGEHEGYSVCN